MPAEDAAVFVNRSGTLPPLVFLRTWPAEPEWLKRLGGHLGPEQPLICLPGPRDDGGGYPRTVSAWVDHHLGHLRRLDLAPPYYLAGFSFGGVLAVEMARRLLAEDTTVAYVALFDSVRPRHNPKGFRPYVEYHLHELLEISPGARGRYVRKLVRGGLYRRWLRFVRVGMRAANRLGIHQRHRRAVKLRHPLARAIRVSYLKYDAEPFDHPVALFHTKASVAVANGDPSLRWSRYLRGGFESYAIEGEHMNIFDVDHVDSVAVPLASSLAAARARAVSELRAQRLVPQQGHAGAERPGFEQP